MTEKQVTSEHAIVFWNSARVQRQAVQAAFDSVGHGRLVPKVDYTAAIRRVAKELCTSIGGEGPVKVFPLSGHESEVAVEVRSFVKGAKRNDLPFLFSLGVTTDLKVVILDADPGHACSLHHEQMTDRANDLWQEACRMIEAADLTEALGSLVTASNGFLLRDGGGIWYLPTDSIAAYEQVAQHLLKAEGVRLSAVRFQPVVNDSLLETVGEELMRRANAVVSGTLHEVEEAVSAGKKIRPAGKASRLETVMAAERMVTHNAALVGRWAERFKDACEVAKERIADAALGAFATMPGMKD